MNFIEKASLTGSDIFVNPPCNSDLFTAPATTTPQVPTTSVLNDQPHKSASYGGCLRTGGAVSKAAKEKNHCFNTPTASVDSSPSWAGPGLLYGEGQIAASPTVYSQHSPTAPGLEYTYNQPAHQASHNFSGPFNVGTLPTYQPHPQGTTAASSICPEDFKYKSPQELTPGARTFNAAENSGRIECSYRCGATFGKRPEWKNHEEIYHEGNRRYFCTIGDCALKWNRFWNEWEVQDPGTLATFRQSGDCHDSSEIQRKEIILRQSFEEFKRLQFHQKSDHKERKGANHYCSGKSCVSGCQHKLFITVPLKDKEVECPYLGCNEKLRDTISRRQHTTKHVNKGHKLKLQPRVRSIELVQMPTANTNGLPRNGIQHLVLGSSHTVPSTYQQAYQFSPPNTDFYTDYPVHSSHTRQADHA